tara:strand:- start:794 stop:1129 length:336 start_codon:yes stop_codon:yes gene_type:complete
MKKLTEKLRAARIANRAELATMYEEFIGYDPVGDHPEIETEEIRKTLTGWMKDRLAEDAIGVAVRSLQDALGVETGDQASYYFGMDRGYEAIDLFAQYIEGELTLEEEGDQ